MLDFERPEWPSEFMGSTFEDAADLLMENIWEKSSTKFKKAKLEFVALR